jgi:hypothetical protein
MVEIHPVQLSIVGPKQNVQLPSQKEHWLLVVLGKVPAGHTSRQYPEFRKVPLGHELHSLLAVPPHV